MGIFEETYGLVPLFASIMLALGYDNLVGGAVVYIGVATGFAAAMTNPFSVGIAQTIADVPLNSGVAYRAVIFAVFEMVSIWYVMRYARKVKQNPELSVLYGCDEVEQSDKKQYDKEVNFTSRRKLCTILFFATIGILLYGTSMLGWYIDEISSLFLAMMVVAGVVGGSSLNEICLTFIESTKSVVSSILGDWIYPGYFYCHERSTYFRYNSLLPFFSSGYRESSHFCYWNVVFAEHH